MARRTGRRASGVPDPDLEPLADDDDGSAWEVVAEQPPGGGRRLGATVSLRLDPQTAVAVRQAARLQQVTVSEFVRRAARTAATVVLGRAPAPRISRTDPPEVVILGPAPAASTAGIEPHVTGQLAPPAPLLTAG